MKPILFEIGNLTIYSYGLMIAVGAIAGVTYMSIQGKRELGISFDQANTLFLLIFVAAVVGGKVFLFFESPSKYLASPKELFTGNGFVFYGSFLFAVPTMLWYFKKQHLPVYRMLDIMAVTTCLVHMFGRIGCFLAGCCYGVPTESVFGVTYTHPACYADPKGVPLHPTQLYEAAYIFLVMVALLYMRKRRVFFGQLFLSYLILYALGRIVIEIFRGDAVRGYVIDGILTHSQFIALLIILVVSIIWWRWSLSNKVTMSEIKKRA